MNVPDSLEDALDPELMKEFMDIIAPPKGKRLSARVEAEVESEDEGTFVIVFEDQELSGEEGFADEPFVSARLPEGAWAHIKPFLQAWVDGFPNNRELAEWMNKSKQLSADVGEAALQGLSKIKDLVVEAEVEGVGTFQVARGTLDEATRIMRVKIKNDALERALEGDMSGLNVRPVKGASLTTEIVAALAPVTKALR